MIKIHINKRKCREHVNRTGFAAAALTVSNLILATVLLPAAGAMDSEGQHLIFAAVRFIVLSSWTALAALSIATMPVRIKSSRRSKQTV